jgi:predicted metal-dependent enzyme (double-stranded beta helix superfamily)
MFDLDRFKADCCAATAGGAGQPAIREIVARAIAEPAQVLSALGEPRRAEVHTLHRAADLTILNVIWGPRMTVMPHNHEMWAVIGIYTGREDNILWRRLPGETGGRIEAAGAKALSEREALYPHRRPTSTTSPAVHPRPPGVPAFGALWSGYAETEPVQRSTAFRLPYWGEPM